ncbi:MAG: pantetheine-phosphate adenylyltransferase [Oscillospiraceae bacterium]|jgi:pantetheine-phosphate adenylyltransferase|nr:pantetheine-phosphate adenylyltransferase [Oscillospiraceae bacterium]
MSVCLIPGSYDPITRGHVDVIQRAAVLFGDVVVAILRNPEKRGWLTWDQREALARAALTGIQGVSVIQFEGLAVDCARASGARVIARGIRSIQDFEYEAAMARANRELSGVDSIETVFLAADPSLAHWSSSAARQLAAFGGALAAVIPSGSLELLTQYILDMRTTAGGKS